jgi:hypothetical protein
MRLSDLNPPQGKNGVYTGLLPDVSGNRHVEITLSGPRPLVERTFADVDFEFTIDPKTTAKDADRLSQALWNERVAPRLKPAPAATAAAIGRKLPKPSTSKDSVVLSLRHVEGGGTWWGGWMPRIAIGPLKSLYVVLPPVCTCWGAIMPVAGTPNLFLTINTPSPPFTAFSMNPGLMVDSISYSGPSCWPWTQFMPWFRVASGFTTSVTDVAVSGHGLP